MKRTMLVAMVLIGLLMLGACGGSNGVGEPLGPAAPTNLQVDSTTLDSVTLSWTDNAANETGFYVEMGDSAVGPFTTVATLGQEMETYTQSTLNSGTYYYYRVCSYNADGDSPYSDSVLATTQLTPDESYPIPAVADSLSWIELYAYDSSGYLTTNFVYDGPGLDDEWATSDDSVDEYCSPTRNPDNTIDYSECYWSPGSDGDWFTGDDAIGCHSTYVYDSAGNRIQRNRYVDPGPDATWETSDDLMDRYDLYSYDSNNRRIASLRYRGPGADGNWFTSDDFADRAQTWTYGPDGNQDMAIRYSHQGIDGTWFTSDDLVSNYGIPEYDSNGIRARSSVYDKGGDGTWFTGDDEMTDSRIYVHDSNGYRLGEYQYNGPGTDGVWFQ